jgi:glucokinase
MRIAVADIGGTHARFALAEIEGGKVVSLSDPVVLKAWEHQGLASAWAAFDEAIDKPIPRNAALAIAGPVIGGPVRFLNSHWVVDPATVAEELSLDSFTLLNDFGAMAHAVDALDDAYLNHLCGPDKPLPQDGAVSVIGAGTGLGVAVLQRREVHPLVLETEGGHIHFAPLNDAEEAVSAALRARYGRASIERVVSGPGLGDIVRSFAPDTRDDAALWASAIEGREVGTREALSLFLDCYGSVTGDLSLAHGSLGVALTGGLTNRLAHLLSGSGFHARFCDKGRYRERMETIPVKLVTHPQPGLFGAAAAFAMEHPNE